MQHFTLSALSPLDGRYAKKIASLRDDMSEYGLFKWRLFVEVRWLRWLACEAKLPELKPFSTKANQYLDRLLKEFDIKAANRIKEIEQTTNHDVKAVEYYLKEKCRELPELVEVQEFIHFACTSEDINNLAYALMVKRVRDERMLPKLAELIELFRQLAHRYASIPMLARTHGQPASPTTVGKEFANFVFRLKKQYQLFATTPLEGKLNGAVGNYNAHVIAYSEVDWFIISKKFVESLGLQFNSHTVQIEPHDSLVTLLNYQRHLNSILIDFARDMWGYIALNYFQQKLRKEEVGSSTMPHKINPIDFENAEGNFGLGNSLIQFLTTQLPTTRWQRDLVDSTILRNLGLCFGYSLLAYESLAQGLSKIEINQMVLENDLQNHWEVLTEAIQTVMRRFKCENPYEKLKALSRGQKISQKDLITFIENLSIPADYKLRLKQLTPATYLGIAAELAKSC